MYPTINGTYNDGHSVSRNDTYSSQRSIDIKNTQGREDTYKHQDILSKTSSVPSLSGSLPRPSPQPSPSMDALDPNDINSTSSSRRSARVITKKTVFDPSSVTQAVNTHTSTNSTSGNRHHKQKHNHNNNNTDANSIDQTDTDHTHQRGNSTNHNNNSRKSRTKKEEHTDAVNTSKNNNNSKNHRLNASSTSSGNNNNLNNNDMTLTSSANNGNTSNLLKQENNTSPLLYSRTTPMRNTNDHPMELITEVPLVCLSNSQTSRPTNIDVRSFILPPPVQLCIDDVRVFQHESNPVRFQSQELLIDNNDNIDTRIVDALSDVVERKNITLTPRKRKLLQMEEQHTDGIEEPYLAKNRYLSMPSLASSSPMLTACTPNVHSIKPQSLLHNEEKNSRSRNNSQSDPGNVHITTPPLLSKNAIADVGGGNSGGSSVHMKARNLHLSQNSYTSPVLAAQSSSHVDVQNLDIDEQLQPIMSFKGNDTVWENAQISNNVVSMSTNPNPGVKNSKKKADKGNANNNNNTNTPAVSSLIPSTTNGNNTTRTSTTLATTASTTESIGSTNNNNTSTYTSYNNNSSGKNGSSSLNHPSGKTGSHINNAITSNTSTNAVTPTVHSTNHTNTNMYTSVPQTTANITNNANTVNTNVINTSSNTSLSNNVNVNMNTASTTSTMDASTNVNNNNANVNNNIMYIYNNNQYMIVPKVFNYTANILPAGFHFVHTIHGALYPAGENTFYITNGTATYSYTLSQQHQQQILQQQQQYVQTQQQQYLQQQQYAAVQQQKVQYQQQQQQQQQQVQQQQQQYLQQVQAQQQYLQQQQQFLQVQQQHAQQQQQQQQQQNVQQNVQTNINVAATTATTTTTHLQPTVEQPASL